MKINKFPTKGNLPSIGAVLKLNYFDQYFTDGKIISFNDTFVFIKEPNFPIHYSVTWEDFENLKWRGKLTKEMLNRSKEILLNMSFEYD